MNTVIGKILSIGQTVNVSKKENEFLKRELILDVSRYDEMTGEKRENYVALQFTQKRCDELNGFNVGDRVEVSFILNGRRYEKDGQVRYITDVVGYKVERVQARESVSHEIPVAPQPANEPKDINNLPF